MGGWLPTGLLGLLGSPEVSFLSKKFIPKGIGMAFNRKTIRADRGISLLGMALVGMLMVALGLGIFLAPSGQVSAQTTTDTTNGSTINVFCLDYGKTFPEGQTIKAAGLADV